ncbi:MAG: hypothetical protein ACI4D7_03370 [Lachnospiraceae bacterium]
MKKFLNVMAVLLIPVILFGMATLHLYRKSEEQSKEASLKRDQVLIWNLEAEKDKLNAALQKVQAGEVEAEPEKGTVLCVIDPTQTFFDETYRFILDQEIKGVMILRNGDKPGKGNRISLESFTKLLEAGWSYGISVTEYDGSGPENWKKAVDAYTDTLEETIGTAPKSYCFMNRYTQDYLDILKERGMNTVLVHDSYRDAEMNYITMVPYTEENLETALNESGTETGLEVWAEDSIDANTDAVYDMYKMLSILKNTNVNWKKVDITDSLDNQDNEDSEQLSSEEQIRKRLNEIDIKLDKLRY